MASDMQKMDDEANIFACYLLMPNPLFRRDVERLDVMDDRDLEKLARRYRVPMAAVVLRLILEFWKGAR